MSQLYIDNDNYVHIKRLRDAISQEHIVDANITAVVRDLEDNDVSPEVPVEYISGTLSQYSGIIPFTADLTDGQQYKLIVECTNYGFHFERIVKATTRQ